MNILIIGRGPGSWTMRGRQLGAALGARVTSTPTDHDWSWAERVVLVKRDGPTWAHVARRWHLPYVWDALDFWRQPADNHSTEAAARALLARTLDEVRPDLFIGATRAMADAGRGVVLEHHARLGLTPAPARERFQVIGYDGAPAYLDRWAPALRTLCAARGWTFVVNPPDLRDVDLLVALRDGEWDGWMCREWKSGVKVVNAIAAGRPIVMQDSAAWRELAPQGSIVDTPMSLWAAIDDWVDYARRQAVAAAAAVRAPAFTVEAIAAQYACILAGVGARGAAQGVV